MTLLKSSTAGEEPRPQGSGLPASQRGFPVSATELISTADTGVPVSTGVNESRSDSFAHQKSKISGDVDSESPTPIRWRRRNQL